MSGSRKRGSKWDSKDERQYSHENVRDGTWPGKAGMAFRDRESEHGYFSPDVGRNGNKWSDVEASNMMKTTHGLPSRESLSGSRGAQKDDDINVDYVKSWKTWDEEETYSMRMSPGLDDWRQQSRRHSPKSDWSRSHSFHRNRSRSWSRSHSRSRSRSPVHGIRRQSGFHERTRSKSGVSSQLCKEFMAGRCRRGNHCHFVHQDIQSHEDGWDSRQKKAVASKYTPNDGKEYLMKSGRPTDCCSAYLKGNCRRGASCRFAHDGASDGFGRGSINEVSRVRENNKRNRDATPERDSEREARSSSDIPCKYFAAGNCRNGKYCRFSHHGQTRASPERRSRGDSGGWGQSSVSVDKLRDGSKPRDRDASYDVEKSRNGPKRDADASNGAEKSWAGPKRSNVDASNDVDKSWTSKWSDTGAFSGGAMSKDTNGNMGPSDPRFHEWPRDERWHHNYDISGKNSETKVLYKSVDVDKDETIPRKIDKDGINAAVSEPRGAEESLGDTEMSPEWNYRINTSLKTDSGHLSHSLKSQTPIDTSLQAHEKNIIRETSSWVHDGLVASHPISTEKPNFQQDHMMSGSSAVALPCDSNAAGRNSTISHIDLNFSSNILPMQSFDQPGPSSSSLPYSNSNAVGQSQVAIPSHSNDINVKGMQNNPLFQEEKPSSKLNLGDTSTFHGNSGTQSTQNMVSNEQLTQLTNLSASLAQLLGKGQQLPQLHAALNPSDSMQVTSLANSGGPFEPIAVQTVAQGPDITLPKQYDPLSDSFEPVKKHDTNSKPSEFSAHPVALKNNADGKPELLANKLLPSSGGSTNDGEYHNNNSSKREPDLDSHTPKQLEPVASFVVKMENGRIEETKKPQEENKNGPSEKVEGDERNDEGKKSKDGKGIRAFKFALVEFVKDLLKPTWKEGQIGKDAYKNIVKKVVDKVTGTMQGASIPQTPEKIEQYLSFSKPKLTKLVQAYVEKFQKS